METNNILITGANGQLGTELSKILPTAILTDSKTLDITNKDMLDNFITQNHIDIIINCAAYTNVDMAEDETGKAELVNVTGPENLAKTNKTVIHISTDYVFDGKNYKPYLPTDETNPLSVYGKTKRDGEIKLLENANTAIIIRTSWLYSSHGKNFVRTMRSLGNTKDSLNVVSDQTGTPTFAGDLARAIVDIIPQIKSGTKNIYHYSNEGVCSWYDFATKIMNLSNLKCKINPIPSSAYPTKAVRPFYSVLNKDSIKSDFNIKIPHWETSLIKCIKEMEK